MTDREELLRHLELVRPALANHRLVPVLTNVCFDGDRITASNDIQAISVDYRTGVDTTVPGELLIKALASFRSQTVALTVLDGTELLLSAGRDRMKLPVTPRADFEAVFRLEEEGELSRRALGTITLSDELLEGISKSMISVSSDKSRPSHTNVVVRTEPDRVVLYSTDNVSLSRCSVKTQHTMGDGVTVMLPQEFCDHLIRTVGGTQHDGAMVLVVLPEAVYVRVQRVRLFSRLPSDVMAPDFEGVYSVHWRDDVPRTKISSEIVQVLERAMLVMEGQVDKAVRFLVEGRRLRVLAKASLGEVHSTMALDSHLGEADFYVDPALVVRACKMCTHMAFVDSAVLMSAGGFHHLIAHSIHT